MALTDRIARIIHQTWKDENIPNRWLELQATWKKHHPHWEYRLWVDGDLRELIRVDYPWFLPTYDSYREHIKRVDAARYFIMHKYGGLYADLDFECFQPMDKLVAAGDLVLAPEPAEHKDIQIVKDRGLDQVICNAWMASRPGHPFWDHVFRELIAQRNQRDTLDATGPFLLTRALRSFPRRDEIVVGFSNELYPVTSQQSWDGWLEDETRRQEIRKHAFAAHHWSGSWWREAPVPATRELPRISCLMVTRGRLALAQRAIRCFLAQTYTNRELVIVDDDTDDSLQADVEALRDPRIVYVREPPGEASLGMLRNVSVRRASGAFVCQWDDDDISHPRRLERQFSAMDAAGAQACFLVQEYIWWPATRRLARSVRRVWEGTMLCANERMPAYSDLRRGEDTPVADAILRDTRVAFLDEPELYTYVVHGENTFEPGHFEEHWSAAEERYEGAAYEAKLQALLADAPVDPGGKGRRPAAVAKAPHLLVLTPVKDAAAFLDRYFENLCGLDYPRDRIAVALLEGDSQDGTHALLTNIAARLADEFARIEVYKRDYDFRLDGPRWEPRVQLRRRSILARSRNYLLSRALRDERWVLWLDVDVVAYPADVVHQLLETGKQIVVPNCLVSPGGSTFDYNTFALTPDAAERDWTPHVLDGIVQPPIGEGRIYLNDMRDRDLVTVDAVGGTMLLVDADIHREGIMFPVAPYRLYIETEGFAMMARDAGHTAWGLPNLEIVHPDHS